MPVDPTISLGIQTPQPPAASGPGSPLGMLNTFSEIQARQNQNLNFQQTFAAKQRAGQIMSASPDLESGFGAMLKDPLVAPFAGSIINEVRQSQKTLLDIQGEQQTQASSGLAAVMKAIPGAIGDPSMLPALISSQMKTLSPTAQARVQPAVDDLSRALMDGLPSADALRGDPRLGAAAASMLQNRFLGIATASGMSADTMRAISGTMAPATGIEPLGPGGAPVPFTRGGSVFGSPAAIPMQAGGEAPNALTAGGSPANPLAMPLPAPAPAPISGLGVTQHAQATESGKFAGTLATEMSTSAKQLPEDLNRINLMQQALGQMQAGGGAQFRSTLGSVLQGFKNAGVGISQDLIDKTANESLASTQIFQAQVRPEVIAQLKQAAQGTGRVMRSEVDAFLAMMSPSIDPEALRQMLNSAKYQAAVQYDMTQKYMTHKNSGRDMLDFYPTYNREMDPYGLPTRAGGGLDFSPISPKSIKGAPPGADLWAGWGEQGSVSRGAVDRLRANPHEAPLFDQKYGAGSASRFLPSGR